MKKLTTILILLLSVTLYGCHASFNHPVAGVSHSLAQYRTKSLSHLIYDLHISVPDSTNRSVTGNLKLHYFLSDTENALILDFAKASDHLLSIRLDGDSVNVRTLKNHIIIPRGELKTGNHYLVMKFIAGNEPLNRNADYMYSLFVPERASRVFPCFDQPDLKGLFKLTINIPRKWSALSNGSLEQLSVNSSRKHCIFTIPPPLSTYQFAFAAGMFKLRTSERDGRRFSMYYRETDSSKVARNTDDLFNLHTRALEWLENYTGIGYPYNKFDFLALPSFQYGGMEHPGAVYYNASDLFLNQTATISDSLNRARLISHETSHMWFGNLVTMQWFNDVWTKEVFASFMAAKIVRPLFPGIDYRQRFLLTYYPAAYRADRTGGTHPIRQKLDNLNNAGNLYGPVIYDKAPIVMRHLEQLVDSANFQKGIRKYLQMYRYGNATWPQFIDILSQYSKIDLRVWNAAWVGEAGRPEISVTPIESGDTLKAIKITQTDPAQGNRIWPQYLNIMLHYTHRSRYVHFYMDKPEVTIDTLSDKHLPDFIIPNGKGDAYGYFHLDQATLLYLTHHLQDLDKPFDRSVAWLDLWDNFLNGAIPPRQYFNLLSRALKTEHDEMNIRLITGYLGDVYWHYLSAYSRRIVASGLEKELWDLMNGTANRSLKLIYFRAYESVATTRDGLDLLRRVWSGELQPTGIVFSEDDFIRMAQILALHHVSGWSDILAQQDSRITDPDRKAEFEFIRPSLSDTQKVLDRFFDRLKDPANRRHEPWVLLGLRYLNDPIRAKSSIKYILPGLEMMEEIQETNDIFFPGNWINAILGGHNSKEAASIVRNFLKQRPDYPHFLRDKILYAADPLFRASRLKEKEDN